MSSSISEHQRQRSGGLLSGLRRKSTSGSSNKHSPSSSSPGSTPYKPGHAGKPTHGERLEQPTGGVFDLQYRSVSAGKAGAESEPETVFSGFSSSSRLYRRYEEHESVTLEEFEDAPRRRRHFRRETSTSLKASSSSSKSNRFGSVFSDMDAMAFMSADRAHQAGGGVGGSNHRDLVASTTRPGRSQQHNGGAQQRWPGGNDGGNAAAAVHPGADGCYGHRSAAMTTGTVSDGELIRHCNAGAGSDGGRGRDQWTSHFSAQFDEKVDTSAAASTNLPKGYRHHRKAPPPPPPTHKPRSASATNTALVPPLAGNSPKHDVRSRSRSATTASHGGVASAAVAVDSGGGAGAGGGDESQVRQQEVMAAIRAFRSMGSPEVRATALQLGNVLHTPKTPDLSAKPLKGVLKRTRADDYSQQQHQQQQ
eukprot:scpid58744/ scgid15364/ 